jgi:hypothetical protein
VRAVGLEHPGETVHLQSAPGVEKRPAHVDSHAGIDAAIKLREVGLDIEEIE